MSKKLVPPVEVDLDRPRQAKCTMATLDTLKEWTGLDLLATAQQNSDIAGDEPKPLLGSPQEIIAALAAFLTYEDESITPGEVKQMIDSAESLMVASQAVMECVSRFFGASDAQIEASRKTAAETWAAAQSQLTSMASGPLPAMTSDSATQNSGA